MSKPRRRDRAKESVLKRQKPRSKRSKLRLGIRYGGLFALAVGGCSLAWITIVRRPKPMPPPSLSSTVPTRQWNLSLKLDQDTPLPDHDQHEILELAQRYIGEGKHEDLERVARAILKLGVYGDVRLMQPAPNQLVISIRKREPVLCVEADRLRLVSSLGDVYGEVSKSHNETCPGPILTGLFEGRVELALNDDMTVILDAESRDLVRESLTLMREARDHGFRFDQLQIRKYRGFSGTIAGGDTEVALGRAPFGYKLQKLREILDKLALKQESAKRIELDYQGKAFVKLKKM